jgi:hypothetical protein
VSTRTIVTSQPELVCELCARRLLRGERHEVFLVDGRPRNVCELCAPRAADAGWVRESDGDLALSRAPTPRRGRGIFERLRLSSRAGGELPGATPDDAPAVSTPELDETAASAVDRRSRIVPHRARAHPAQDAPPKRGEYALGLEPHADWHGPPSELEPSLGDLERAASVFNDSEFPRRVAGVMRSLGAPDVCVRRAEHLDSAVRITIAWELCWYRYEVDLSEEPATARAIAQGTELTQLPREERSANASASETGTLTLY